MTKGAKQGRVRVGIGGWNYEPWRTTFYPKGVTKAKELEYASRQVSVIEINSTFYRTQKASTFAKWRDATPDDFVFAVKAARYSTIRKVLAEAAEPIRWFVESGLEELGRKLGPILWQFAPTKKFEPEDFEAFLALLPKEIGGRPARHALEPRHESFATPEFVQLARRYGAAIVYTDSDEHPSIGDITSDFAYARLVKSESTVETGYNAVALDAWAKIAATFARGSEPAEFPRIDTPAPKADARDVFMLFINGAKERAPAAAQALLSRLEPS